MFVDRSRLFFIAKTSRLHSISSIAHIPWQADSGTAIWTDSRIRGIYYASEDGDKKNIMKLYLIFLYYFTCIYKMLFPTKPISRIIVCFFKKLDRLTSQDQNNCLHRLWQMLSIYSLFYLLNTPAVRLRQGQAVDIICLLLTIKRIWSFTTCFLLTCILL